MYKNDNTDDTHFFAITADGTLITHSGISESGSIHVSALHPEGLGNPFAQFNLHDQALTSTSGLPTDTPSFLEDFLIATAPLIARRASEVSSSDDPICAHASMRRLTSWIGDDMRRQYAFDAGPHDYWNRPYGVRIELIDGRAYPVPAAPCLHQHIVLELAALFRDHLLTHDIAGVVGVAPLPVNLFGDGSCIVEPDVVVTCDTSILSDRGYEGAPALVVEVVTPETAYIDYIAKPPLYLRAGVREVWAVDPLEGRVVVYVPGPDWSPLNATIYPLSIPVSSSVFDGLTIDVSAIVSPYRS